jgi:hypothetical protein
VGRGVGDETAVGAADKDWIRLQIFDVRSQVISAGDMTDAADQKDEDAEAEISSFFKRHQYKPVEFKNPSFGFISSKSREISDEISHFSSKGIAEGAISEKKNGKDRGKVLDFERIEPKTQVKKRL